MPHIVIHKNGKYNVYSTIIDEPCFERGITLEALIDAYRHAYGKGGLMALEECLDRVHKTGTSSRLHENLEGTVLMCLHKHKMTIEDFIKKYL